MMSVDSSTETNKQYEDQLSLTAAFIMIKLWGVLQYPSIRSIFPAQLYQYCAHLTSQLPAPLHYFHKGLKQPILRSVLSTINELGLRGDLGHIIARKKKTFYWIDQISKQFSSDSCQFVFMGGGLDYAPVYTSRAGFTTFSLEIPATAKIHQRVLASSFINTRHHIIPSPEGAPLLDSLLAQSAFNIDKTTIFVAEGFWDYLTTSRVNVLLSDIKKLASRSPNVQLWSTLFVLNELPWYYQWSYRYSVRSVGEQLTFSYSKESFLNLLENFGAHQLDFSSYTEMEDQLLAPTSPNFPVLKGFYMGKWQF